VSGDRLDELDYYTLLQVEPSATADAIRGAFHRFALKYHPDNHTDGGPEKLARANQIYRRGAEAYRVLSNPEARRAYGAQLAAGKLRYEPEGGGTGETRRPSVRSRLPAPKARPFYARAQQALKEGSYQQARLNLQVALGHDPENPELLALLAEAEAGGKGG
jgi:curved DNA-binding protein CbpA